MNLNDINKDHPLNKVHVLYFAVPLRVQYDNLVLSDEKSREEEMQDITFSLN